MLFSWVSMDASTRMGEKMLDQISRVEKYYCPIDSSAYDRSPLTDLERAELSFVVLRAQGMWPQRTATILHRLLRPIYEVIDLCSNPSTKASKCICRETTRILLKEMQQRGTTFWEWSQEAWCESLGTTHEAFEQRYPTCATAPRQYLILIAYSLGGFTDYTIFGRSAVRQNLARKVFGNEAIETAIARVTQMIRAKRASFLKEDTLLTVVCDVLLLSRSPFLEDVTIEVLESVYHNAKAVSYQKVVVALSHALAALGLIPRSLPGKRSENIVASDSIGIVSDEWQRWCQRWYETSSYDEQTRKNHFSQLIKVGRWLAEVQPGISSPGQWTDKLAAEFVATVEGMKFGDWTSPYHFKRAAERVGRPLGSQAKNLLLTATSHFFHDCQQWGWIPTLFNPIDCFRGVSSPISNHIKPNPRVIDTETWDGIIWAATNLTAEDLPRFNRSNSFFYPLEMVRAIAIVWCFAGLSSEEICRLQVGGVQWPQRDSAISKTSKMFTKNECCLEVPHMKPNKGTVYTKPVIPLVGLCIADWENVLAVQPQSVEPATGEPVQYLFSFRGRRISPRYVERILIPLLCNKAGVSEHDSQGKITSYRGTMTSRLAQATRGPL